MMWVCRQKDIGENKSHNQSITFYWRREHSHDNGLLMKIFGSLTKQYVAIGVIDFFYGASLPFG